MICRIKKWELSDAKALSMALSNRKICEGTLRSNAVKNGKVIDMKMYSLLKAEI